MRLPQTHLHIHKLLAIPALHCVLNDGITSVPRSEVLVQAGEAVERHAQADEVDCFVKEDAIWFAIQLVSGLHGCCAAPRVGEGEGGGNKEWLVLSAAYTP